MGTPIDYASPSTPSNRRWSRRVQWMVGGVFIAIALFILVPDPFVWTVTLEMDAVTGTERTTETSPFGRVTQTIKPSALETKLASRGITWVPVWDLYSERRDAIGGRSRACGQPPAIYDLRPGLAQFAAAATDDELRAFAQTMQTGTEDEQKSAVKAICDRYYP